MSEIKIEAEGTFSQISDEEGGSLVLTSETPADEWGFRKLVKIVAYDSTFSTHHGDVKKYERAKFKLIVEFEEENKKYNVNLS